MVMLEEDLYLAVPPILPMGIRILLIWLIQEMRIHMPGRFQAHPPDMQQLFFQRRDFVPNVIFESDTTESVRKPDCCRARNRIPGPSTPGDHWAANGAPCLPTPQ